VDPAELNLFFEPKDRLRLTVGDRLSYHTVKPVWASPLARPNHWLALLNGKGEEIVTIEDTAALPRHSWEAAQEELRRRYLTATVTRVISANFVFGSTYWHVESSRGEREFVTQSLQENALWLSPTHLMLLDVDGNRFEIPNVSALDEPSQTLIGRIL